MVYTPPAEYPYEDLPSTDTPVYAATLNEVVDSLVDLDGAGGRVADLEANPLIAADVTGPAVGQVVAVSDVSPLGFGLVAGPAQTSAADYGAIGDGTTDDTAALQAWLDAVPIGGHGFLPAGVYRITSGLTLAPDRANTVLSGAGGVGQSELLGAGASTIAVDGAVVGLTCGTASTTAFQGIVLRDLHVRDEGGVATGGLLIRRQNNFTLDNVGVSGFTSGYGVHIDGTGNASQYGQMHNPKIGNCQTGLLLTLVNGLRVIGGMFDGNNNSGAFTTDTVAIDVVSGDTLKCFGTVIQFYDTGITLQSGEGHELHGCRFEGFGTGVVIGAIRGARVIGGNFSNSILGGGGTAASIASGADGAMVMGATIGSVTTAITDAGTDTVILDETTFRHAGTPPVSPAVRIYRTGGSQSCASDAITTIDFTTTEFNDSTAHYQPDLTSNLVVINRTRLYMVQWEVAFSGGDPGERVTILSVNGSTRREAGVPASVAGQFIRISACALLRLDEGDQVRLGVYVSGGAAVNVAAAAVSDTGLSVASLGA